MNKSDGCVTERSTKTCVVIFRLLLLLLLLLLLPLLLLLFPQFTMNPVLLLLL